MIEVFLRRPLFAGVLSFVVLLAGLICIPILPISQYPQISPPTVTVTANYPGADAEAVVRSVTTPLEININGSDGLQYMQSYSSSNGIVTITCTFALGTNPTTDQTNVQHGVDLTLAQLPTAVQQQGVTVQKSSGNITIAVAMLSTSSSGQRRCGQQLRRPKRHRGAQADPGCRSGSGARRPDVRHADLGRSAQTRRPTASRSTPCSTRSSSRMPT